MATGIFKGPKGALIFMGVTVLGVLLLVGTEDDEGALVVAADELGRDRAQFEQVIADEPHSPSRPVPIPQAESGFDEGDDIAEEQLIDDAAGYDPSPEPVVPFDSGAGSGDVSFVENYGEVQIN